MCWGQHLHLRLAARFEPVGFVCGMLWLSSVTSCFPSPAAPAGPAGHPAHAAGAPHPEAAGGGGRPALCWVQGRQAGAGGLHCAGFGAGRHPPTLPPTPCRLLRVAPLPQELVQRCGVNPKYEEAGREEGGAARVHVKASPGYVVALSAGACGSRGARWLICVRSAPLQEIGTVCSLPFAARPAPLQLVRHKRLRFTGQPCFRPPATPAGVCLRRAAGGERVPGHQLQVGVGSKL